MSDGGGGRVLFVALPTSSRECMTMPDWLTQSFVQPEIDWRVLAIRLALATLFGLMVSGIYRSTRDLARVAASFPGTLVLLCVLIAMVTQVIGDNVALAFSLVGALSIVRFRTAVQDTKDTAFVIFAVAVGMAVGAGHVAVAAGGTVAAGLVAWLFHDVVRQQDHRGMRPYHVDVQFAWSPDVDGRVRQVLASHDSHAEVVAAGTAKKGTLVELTYRLRLPRGMALAALVNELRAIESVHGVAVHQPRTEA
ncbi:DUF4956 domain-containing protein [bacterium]|nr:DUF4956 domain-containing protein [bacterium]